MDTLVARSRRLRKVVLVTIFSVVLDLALSVTLGVVVLSVRGQGDQIQAQQSQTAATRHKVLCPLYTVLLAAIDPAQRPPGLPPEKVAVYDRGYLVIKQGYDALDCSRP